MAPGAPEPGRIHSGQAIHKNNRGFPHTPKRVGKGGLEPPPLSIPRLIAPVGKTLITYLGGAPFCLQLCTLASGSSGNSLLVSDGRTHVLIDAGIRPGALQKPAGAGH